MSLKPKLNKKLAGVNSAQDYSYGNNQLLAQNNSAVNETVDSRLGHNPLLESDFIEERENEQEEIISNPEDCKDTIFSGEGEILGTVGETNQENNEYTNQEPEKGNNKELIKKLQNENKTLKAQMKKMITLFLKFKNNTNINLQKENIKLASNENKSPKESKSK